jgi:hypothetical protein
MEYVINFVPGREAAIITTSGPASVDRFRHLNQTLVDDPRFQPGMPILIDHTALDASALTATDIRAIGEFVATIGERIGASSIAVVVPDRLTFGFVRMGEMRANQPQLNVRIFYSLADAAAWLLSHGHPDAGVAADQN